MGKKQENNMLEKRLEFLEKLSKDEEFFEMVDTIYNLLSECFKNNNKLLICGNGGSAADSQHIAAEFIVKLKTYRKSLPAIALSSNVSVITAIANDFSYESIFERQVEGIGRDGDVLVGLSTSGNSINIAKAFIAARKMNVKTIAISGDVNSKISLLADYKLIFDTYNTQIIQEIYMMIFHIIIEKIENQLIYKKGS